VGVDAVKAFVLVRGVESGTLYLYDSVTYMHLSIRMYVKELEFVVDSDDVRELKRFQYIANDKKLPEGD
jgi:hypothetical protein